MALFLERVFDKCGNIQGVFMAKYKTGRVESIDDLTRDQNFCAYVGGIVKKYRDQHGWRVDTISPDTQEDLYQEAWVVIIDQWGKTPGQTKGFYAKAVGYYFNNKRRMATSKKRRKILPVISLEELDGCVKNL